MMGGKLRKYWGWQREEEREEAHVEKEERRNQADRLIGYALDNLQGLLVDQHGAPHALVGASLCRSTRGATRGSEA